ncbi:MAG: hypothetical protein Q9218_006248, partial [Villophora microphyllina]
QLQKLKKEKPAKKEQPLDEHSAPVKKTSAQKKTPAVKNLQQRRNPPRRGDLMLRYEAGYQLLRIKTDSHKPPYLKGVYILWKGNPVWDADAKVFLGNGRKDKMARVLGRIMREKGPGLEMKVLSVCEVSWAVGVRKGHFLP